MLIALWIINILLAIAQLGAGGMKVIKSKAALKEAGLGWVDDFSAGSVKLIGLAEVVGAIGLILPVALNIAPILAPIAAVGLTILMIGAVAVHARRKEPVVVPLVLTLLGIASAVIGFIAL